MGLYGSPDVSNLYSNKEDKKIKRKSSPQTSIWLWVAMIVFNIIFVLSIGIRFDSIMSALILDSIILAVVSAISLIYNLVKKNRVKNDIIFILSSIVAFFILSLILGTIA